MNREQPLGLPPGSVTAILALLSVGVVGYLAVAQLPIPELLGTIATAAVAYFFGHNVSTTGAAATATTVRALMTPPPGQPQAVDASTTVIVPQPPQGGV